MGSLAHGRGPAAPEPAVGAAPIAPIGPAAPAARHLPVGHLAPLALLLASLGCGPVDEVPPRPDTGAATVDTAAPADAAPSAVAHTLVVQVGTNPVGAKDPSAFHPLAAGAPVAVEWGFQGFYMVVLAVRADGPGPVPVWLSSSFTLDGDVVASARMSEDRLLPGGDGWFYAYDHFVLTPGWESWVDHEVQLTFSVEDEDGVVLGDVAVPVHATPPPP